MSTPLTLPDVRRRLKELSGPRYWRSFEELAQTDEFQDLLEREFNEQLPGPQTELSRRRFLQIMGAGLALAGLNACTIQPDEDILPYAKQPEQIVPGKPLYFATALPVAHGFSNGVLVESHTGRPTKIEGNPEHPGSQGGTDLFTQAQILGLYDPDRSQTPLNLGRIRSWDAFAAELDAVIASQTARDGAGLRILSTASTSPTTARQRRAWLDRFPNAQWHTYEPTGLHNTQEGARRAFGTDTHVYYDLSNVKVVLGVESNFLTEGAGAVRYARDFARTRRAVEGATMSRFYCVESGFTATGASADHRFALAPHAAVDFLQAVAAGVGVAGISTPSEFQSGDPAQQVAAVVDDLTHARGRSAILVGEPLPAAAHVLGLAINDALGNLGQTVRTTEPVLVDPQDSVASLESLVRDIRANQVDFLLILDGNPLYDAPSDLDFKGALQQVPLRAHLAQYDDETSQYCQWHLPLAHPLESWSDSRAHDGTASILQPLVSPLYEAKTVHQVLEYFAELPTGKSRDIVQSTWRAERGALGFARDWNRWLHDGVVSDSQPAATTPRVDPGSVATAAGEIARSGHANLTILFRSDPTVGDGRYANNAWLQECPKPLTKLTWDNALLVAPSTAESWGVTNEDVVEVTCDTRKLQVPVWIVPGHATECATLHLGYGRTRCGQVGRNTGVDAYPLRISRSVWQAPATVAAGFGRAKLACTQDHHSMEGRDLIRRGTAQKYHDNPHFMHDEHHAHVDASLSLMPGYDYSEGYKWGLTIDLSACTGCNACVVACQAENNVPVVGKDEVLRGREMHWLRMDRYFTGELDHPEAVVQPVLCMHCEQAPCEVVCPVSATVHSDEGLNDMVYNRCVGTRYCSNNCPYKVRRFNYYHYSDRDDSQKLKMQRNPDVTVRSRGVMEKCTYCVQRISQGRIEAKVTDLPLGDGDVVTACQQACPSQAIAFGDLNDTQSQIHKWQTSDLNYGLLAELGTRPRTTYLARLNNPHPSLAGEDHGHEGGRHG